MPMRATAVCILVLGVMCSQMVKASTDRWCGSAADYQRAAQIDQLPKGKVSRESVRPRWSADGRRFWYCTDLPGGPREFTLVDTATGAKAPAFDHARLADAVGRAAGSSSSCSVVRLEFSATGLVAIVRLATSSWHCCIESYAVTPCAEQSTLPRRDMAANSDRTGPETSVTFLNRTDSDAMLFWLDSDGERQPYGTVGAHSSRDMHTYDGHVWLVTGTNDVTLGVYEAVEEPGVVVIDGTKPVKRESEEPAVTQATNAWRPFVKDHNVWLRNGATDESAALTTNGSANDSYDDLFVSPDGTRLVALKTVPAEEHTVHMVESSPKDQLQPKLHSISYLKPGDRIAVTKPHLFDLVSRLGIPVSDALFPTPWSIEDIRWSADSGRFTFLYNQRGHQVLRIVAVDGRSGAATAIVDERSTTFVDYAEKFFVSYLDKTGEIVWMSERDGWNHLYLYDARTGTVKQQITRGSWVVRSVDRVDEAARQVWFYAGGIRPGQDPYYLHYCRADLDGSNLVVLTEGDGTHSISMSPDNRFFVDTWSRVDLPPVTELRRSDSGALVCELERADATALLATGWLPPEPFAAPGRDGTTLVYGIILKPVGFDPERKYPVIENIYAGTISVPKEWAASYGMQAFAELGFVLVMIDGMGTPFRSKAFHDVRWKNLGDAGFPDRIAWTKAAAQTRPYMDISRVGIFGGSAGGQNALSALLRHPEFYKAVAADCGCHDNRMDKIWWNELYMGWPVGPEYAESSNVTLAHKLEGKLLLIVGELDDNVDPASTMQVVNALIKADKDFDLLVMPGGGHGAGGSAYGQRRQQDFFVRHLLGTEPRGTP